MLWIAGEAPVFLVAHDLSGAGVILFAVAVLAVPTVVFIGFDYLAGLLPESVREIAAASIRGLLIALVVVPPMIHALDAPSLVSFVLLVGVACAATWLWLRFRAVSTFVVTLCFAPVVFLLWFVGFSGAEALAFSGEEPTSVATGSDRDVSVIWVVFDQLPLGLLIDENGEIQAKRYPNFARLAKESTWYPNATTVASATSEAVPAALTGIVAEPEDLPIASMAPNNLFTLLGTSHRVYAWETFTQLCPDSLCSTQDPEFRPSIVDDTWILTVRRLLGDRLSDHLVPPIDGGWSGFGDGVNVAIENEATSISELENMRVRGDDRERIDEFIASLQTSTGPSVHYLHIEKPHEPFLFLPDGRLYRPCPCFTTGDDGRWPETAMTAHRLQAYVLQTMYVDTVLGRILDAIEETKLQTRSVLVVMSDHGAALTPGLRNRVLTKATSNDILPVPMFIRSPGQSEGVRDERPVQITSILPTVLDLLGVDWKALGTDGVSLLDPEALPPPRFLAKFLLWGPDDRADPTQSPSSKCWIICSLTRGTLTCSDPVRRSSEARCPIALM